MLARLRVEFFCELRRVVLAELAPLVPELRLEVRDGPGLLLAQRPELLLELGQALVRRRRALIPQSFGAPRVLLRRRQGPLRGLGLARGLGGLDRGFRTRTGRSAAALALGSGPGLGAGRVGVGGAALGLLARLARGAAGRLGEVPQLARLAVAHESSASRAAAGAASLSKAACASRRLRARSAAARAASASALKAAAARASSVVDDREHRGPLP